MGQPTNNQVEPKSAVTWIDESRQIILHCSPKLWELLNSYRSKGIQDLDLLTLAKLYKEIKSLEIKIEEEKKDGKV